MSSPTIHGPPSKLAIRSFVRPLKADAAGVTPQKPAGLDAVFSRHGDEPVFQRFIVKLHDFGFLIRLIRPSLASLKVRQLWLVV